MGYEPDGLLGRLVGFRLYSVQFVMDHVQLHFDGPTQDTPVLHCDTMPAVAILNQTFADGCPGYADALRSLISATVVRTEEATGTGLRIEFDRGTLVLHPTTGEDSFEDLA
ncbi:hypothetical protein [Lentzea sp. NPDC003310]|uniref:hypothetical protein n=1 Tax=Lentzea sp. NPDC003310 TaxID=3154447 RepID=UPI0033B85346